MYLCDARLEIRNDTNLYTIFTTFNNKFSILYVYVQRKNVTWANAGSAKSKPGAQQD